MIAPRDIIAIAAFDIFSKKSCFNLLSIPSCETLSHLFPKAGTVDNFHEIRFQLDI